MNTDFATNLKFLLGTQDNRMTSDVMFIVQQKIKGRWEFVTACLTENGAQDFINCNGHNLHSPRIYGWSGYRNREWINLRNYFLGKEVDI